MKLLFPTLKTTFLSSACAGLFCAANLFVLQVSAAFAPHAHQGLAEAIGSGAGIGLIGGIICFCLTLVPNFIGLFSILHFKAAEIFTANNTRQFFLATFYGVLVFAAALLTFIYGLPSRGHGGPTLRVLWFYFIFLLPAAAAFGIATFKIAARGNK